IHANYTYRFGDKLKLLTSTFPGRIRADGLQLRRPRPASTAPRHCEEGVFD
ncbi:MAG: hypothetical protein IT368_12455, partial [Candidatus Hydrogenedentes bacterium]|nr:hypothetical protein [Candidatus Hydrogenedentota bacterium]